jgi:hypothetical protein
VARRRAWFERLLVASAAAVAVGLFLGGWFWLCRGRGGGDARLHRALRRLKVQRDEARRVVREFDRGLGLGPAGARSPHGPRGPRTAPHVDR